MATDGAKASAHALIVLAPVKNRIAALVVSSTPCIILVVSGSGSVPNFVMMNDSFDLKYHEK